MERKSTTVDCKSTVRVAVVIPNWNGAAHLRECLESLEAQTFKAFRAIVVDNGSTDASLRLIRAEFPWVTLLELGRNAGFSAAVNAGICAATAGEYVVLLNNDTRAERRWLERLVHAMDTTPSASFGASRMVLHHAPHLIDAAGDGWSLRRAAGYGIGQGKMADAFAKPGWVFGACAGAAIYRRSLFDDIGLFDEEFFLIFEDVDIDLRAQVAGHRCLYIPGAVVHHKRGASTDSASLAIAARAWRNRIWVVAKNLPPALFALSIGFLMLEWLRYVAHRAYGWLWISTIRRARRRFQKSSAMESDVPQLPSIRRGSLATEYLPVIVEGLKALPRKRRETMDVRRLSSRALLPVLMRPFRAIDDRSLFSPRDPSGRTHGVHAD